MVTQHTVPVGGVRDWVLHVDMDQFLAAVEIRRRPELAGLPVVVGGDGDPTRPRQVVATASYEARAFGVDSGMPLRAALRKCPDAVFLPTDRPAYDAASEEVMATLRSFPVVVEVWGWDEAYVGVRTDDPEALAYELRAAVLERTGLSCAVGIGDNKQQAKLAVRAVKPGGVGRLTTDMWDAVMGDRPVDALVGVGPRTGARLCELGLTTVRELGAAPVVDLVAAFGPTTGRWLALLGRGGGDRTVSDEPWVARSRSKEQTFPQDLTEPGEVAAAVERLAGAVTDEVVAQGRVVMRVAVKVRTRSFHTTTKIMKLAAPTTDRALVQQTALTVLARIEVDRPVRLLGVRVELVPPPEGYRR